MLSTVAETFVPVYTLQQTSETGSKDFEIMRNSGLTQKQKDLFFVPHRKDFYLFAFAKSGSVRHWGDMVPFTGKPDTLYFSSPPQVFLKEEGTFEATAICFTQDFLDMEEGGLLNELPIIQNLNNGHELCLSAADVAFTDDITNKLLEEYKQGQGWQNSMLLAYLRILLIYLSRLYKAQFPAEDKTPERALLHRYKTLIAGHFTQHHDVATYAAMLNLSAGHFSELIKKQSGKAAMEHIHDRLLLEAKRLLFHTDASIKEIAFQLGFEEASYFNRFFRRLTGSTPLAYRNSIREKYH